MLSNTNMRVPERVASYSSFWTSAEVFGTFWPHHFVFKTTMKHIFQRGMPQIHQQPHIAQQQQISTQSTVCHLPCVKVYSLTINVEVETEKTPNIRVCGNAWDCWPCCWLPDWSTILCKVVYS